jgi:hypothetical protein
MKKLLALTTIVWVSASVSAGALAWWLGRPPTPVVPTRVEAMTIAAPAALDLAPIAKATVETLMMPDIIIVAPRPHALAAVAPPEPRDISVMHCSEWVELRQGPAGRHVQYCD